MNGKLKFNWPQQDDVNQNMFHSEKKIAIKTDFNILNLLWNGRA